MSDGETEAPGRMPAEHMTALLTVSTALASSLELPVVLQTSVESAVEVLGLDTGAIYLLDDDEMYLGATTPPLPPGFPDGLRTARLPDHPHIMGCLDSRDTVYVADARSSAELSAAERGVVEARGLRTILFVPLLVEDRYLGALIVGTTADVRAFDPPELDLCRTLACEIALAVENARLFDSLLSAHAETQALAADLEKLVAERTKELAAANDALRTQALELQERTSQLIEADAAKTRFVRSMSHEFRTPLNSIIGFSGVMLSGAAGELTEEQQRQLEMISTSGSHLLALVNDMLDLSCIEAGALRLSADEIDVSALIEECVAAAAVDAKSKRLSVAVEIPADPLTLISDLLRVRQVLLNLIDNAVKFTDAGSVTVSVSGCPDELVCFQVADTGPGIANEMREAVFREFVQGDVDTGSVAGGAGLGLAISRRLAEALGGRLTLTDRDGGGSVFTLALPAGPPAKTD